MDTCRVRLPKRCGEGGFGPFGRMLVAKIIFHCIDELLAIGTAEAQSTFLRTYTAKRVGGRHLGMNSGPGHTF